jgi:hypothetical protein
MAPVALLSLSEVALVAGFICLGYLLARALAGRRHQADLLGLAPLLGTGLLTWLVFLQCMAGAPLRWTVYLSSALILLGGAAILLLGWKLAPPALGRLDSDFETHAASSRLVLAAGWITFGGLICLALVDAVGQAYSEWDAIAIWAVKGYGMGAEHSLLAGAHWGAHGLSYPLNLPLSLALIRLVTGDLLPGSKFLFPLSLLGLLFGLYGFWRWGRVRPHVGLLGMLLLLTTPIVFQQGTNGYANLPFTACLVLGVLWAVRGQLDADPRAQLVSGVLLGLAIWTRPEGLYVVVLVMLGLLLARRITGRGRVDAAHWIVPPVLVAAPWLAFSALQEGSRGTMARALAGFLQGVMRGDLHPEAFYPIVRRFIHLALTPSIFGVLLPVALILLAAHARQLHPRRNPLAGYLAAAVCAAGVGLVAFFYLSSYAGDLAFFLVTALDRMSLPALALLMAWAVLSTGSSQGSGLQNDGLNSRS